MRYTTTLLTAGFLLCSSAFAADKTFNPKNEDEKVFYAIGQMIGKNLGELNVQPGELEAIIFGLKDQVNNQTPQINMSVYANKVQQLSQERMQLAITRHKESGKQFIDTYMKAHPNARKTASGLVYEIMSAGSQTKPLSTDTVEVHYEGALINGEIFDSSIKRGKPVSFPLDRVIKGWTEGLQLVGEGGKIKLIIPSELAYGERGAPPSIPGGSTLVFDVELLKIEKAQ